MAENKKRRDALFAAIPDGDIDFVEKLFQACAPLVKDDMGNTPLHLAALHGRLDLVKVFMSVCSIQTLNLNQKTPRDLAENEGQADIVNMLNIAPLLPLEALPIIELTPAINPNHRRLWDPIKAQGQPQEELEIKKIPLPPTKLEKELERVLNILKTNQNEFDNKLIERDGQLNKRFEELENQLTHALNSAWEQANHADPLDLSNRWGQEADFGLQAVKIQLFDYQAELHELGEKIKINPNDETLQGQINHLQEEVILLKEDYDRRTHLPKRLEALFKLDEGDERHSLRNFYYQTLNKLTAFAVGVQALRSGMVQRAPRWKDTAATGIFGLLGAAVSISGAAGSAAWGAGAIIPLIGKPLLAGAEYLWEVYRDDKKQKEIKQAASYFSGGLEAIDRQNQYLAYALTCLLRMQLPHCKPEGQKKIVDDWLYNLCYNVMKMEGGSEEDSNNVATALVRIDDANQKKHHVKTWGGDRKWDTEGIFEESGVSFNFENEMIYHSCRIYSEKNGSTKVKNMTRADKYGYLSFPTLEEATLFEKAMTEKILHIYPKETVKWMRDAHSLARLNDPLTPSNTHQLLSVIEEFEKFKEMNEDQRKSVQLIIDAKDKQLKNLSFEVEQLKQRLQLQEDTIKNIQEQFKIFINKSNT